MHKNAQKAERKSQTKICCHYTRIARLDDAFLEVFLTASKPSRRSITAAKRKEKVKKERPKKKFKNRKALRHRSLFCACPSQTVANRDASGKKAKLS